ncbi:hypothetical protein G9A89_018917 [Geosiphon pyriformis]|nr:hypothetical protein G9A89_018917 [Geosiphon pyriformis]
MNIEKKCLVEKTSFDHGDDGALTKENSKQTSKGSKIHIKKALGKPLRKINFLDNNINDILLDKPVVLSLFLKNLVNVSVKKSFTLDINLDNIVEKSVQEKLVVVRKLFSKINSFREASIPSKFAGIIKAMFTFELSLVQASKKAVKAKILVNSNLKKLFGHSDRTVVLKEIPIETLTEAVHAALSGFGVVMSIKMQLTKCTVVCFELANSLNAVMETTSVLRGVNMHWSPLGFSKCAECGRLGHISLGCAVEMKPIFLDISDVEKKFAVLESSLASLVGQISKISLVWKIATYNVKDLNNPAKQHNVIHWHKEKNNLISIVIETKLKGKIYLWIMNKFNSVWVFTSGLYSGHLSSNVAIIMNNSLARHVCKVSEVFGGLFSLKLLFKNNLSVSILGLYAGASLVVWFSQAGKINSLIAKAVNEFSFIILGGDFNENGTQKCASFKKCFDLGLVNSLKEINAVVDGSVADVENYFNTNHKAIYASMGLGGLFDIYLGLIYKQNEFKDATAANTAMFLDEFELARKFSDLDAIWNIVCKVIIFLANGAFKKKWFKSYNEVFIKEFSKLYNLEILVSKIVKTFRKVGFNRFESLLRCWVSINSDKASVVWNLVSSGASLNCVCSALCGVKRFYHVSKLAKFLQAKKLSIKLAIEKRMESFVVNKGHTIHSVLECPFHKVVLDHLVSDSGLILDPVEVKNKVDSIIEGWTRKRAMLKSVPDLWQHQYLSLDYFNNDAFSGVMNAISLDDLTHVIKDLPDSKAAGLSEAWVLMILKSYEWEDTLTNTRPIALIETACKILSKLLPDRILSACEQFSVLKGTTIQFPIFAICLVVEDALKKNCELWLVLQDMCKAYNSVGQHYLYNSIGCMMVLIRRQESLCEYNIDIKFVVRTGRIEHQGSLTLFLAANAFVNDTIWKTVAIPINQRVSNILLSISGLPISIARKKKSYQYLGIYLSFESLFKPSLAKVDLGLCEIKCNAAAYFLNLDLGIGAKISGLVSSTMVELWAIALALECVLSDSSVIVYSDSKAALDACVIGNKHADELASLAMNSSLALPVLVKEKLIKAGRMAVSGNIHHFAHKIFRFINHAHWKIGPGFNVIDNSLCGNVNWFHTALV